MVLRWMPLICFVLSGVFGVMWGIGYLESVEVFAGTGRTNSVAGIYVGAVIIGQTNAALPSGVRWAHSAPNDTAYRAAHYRFMGFGYHPPDGRIWFLLVPLWFLTIVPGGVGGVVLWRRRMRKGPGFDVERPQGAEAG